jgi:hypothetical protein
MNEELNGTPEQQIPLKEDQRYLASSGYTTTFSFNFVDANVKNQHYSKDF